MAEASSSASRRIWWGVAVVAVVALALFLRVYWNMDAAVGEDGFRLASGSDPYYHKRAIDHIQESGWKTLLEDPLLNYPYGSVNPNPPLFEWSVAATGLALQPFFGGDLATATWWAMLWSPAIWGALTVIPIYVLGTELFDRKAGFLAGLFWAVSTASMDHTGLGASDHDAFYLFFLVLGFAFYAKMIHAVRGDTVWVERWRDGSLVATGLGRFFRERRAALGYAVLAGISLAAVALTWKGFPYATGIVFAYAGIQLVVDHWRNRDSTGLFVGTLVVLALPVILAMPYYGAAGVLSFLKPGAYIAGAFAVAGLVLVPTRDLPSILVLPLAVLAGLVLIGLTFVIPALEGVRVQLLYATVYFKQSRLYTTIAEAHPSSFDDIVFGIGPVVFLVGLVGLFALPLRARRTADRDYLFLFVWGALALYMAYSAVRFLFNAVPAFVILGGWLLAAAIDWFDFPALWRSSHGGGVVAGARRGFSAWHVVGVLAVVLLLVAPAALLAVDAAIPAEVENDIVESKGRESFAGKFVEKRLGAYTQGFLPSYWEEGLEWLDAHDAAVADPAERPAFLAWWDYGHWAIAVGNHPASADNFQNGYVHAGNFLAALNETHAVQLLAGRQLERDYLSEDRAKALLGEAGVTDVDAAYADIKSFEYAPNVDLDQAVAFLDLVEKETGKRIRYVAVDARMLEYDSPQTPNIDKSGIFYAPLFLAEKDVDSYFETVYVGNDGQSYSEEEAAEQVRRSSVGQGSPNFQIVSSKYEYKEPFFQSMFWRAYSGIPPRTEGPTWEGDALEEGLDAPQPAFGLEHFRLVYANDALRILEYYPGAKISGVVTQDGRPVPNAVVGVLDDSGDITYPLAGPRTRAVATEASMLDVPHDRAVTDAQGRFTLTAPFGMTRGVTVVVNVNGVEAGERLVQVTREQAQAGADLGDVASFDIQPGEVEGLAFVDADGDGRYNASSESPASGVTISVGGKNATTGSDGRYRITDVPPGQRAVTTDHPSWQVADATAVARVRPGNVTTHDVALEPRTAAASGRFAVDADGDGQIGPQEPLASYPFRLVPDEAVGNNTAALFEGVTRADGSWTGDLAPGSYVLTATHSVEGTTYTLEDRFTVPPGATAFARDFLLRAQ